MGRYQVKVAEMPECDFCDNEAVVDGKTTEGPWAYMCWQCFLIFGVGLGIGKGQVLILEVPDKKVVI